MIFLSFVNLQVKTEQVKLITITFYDNYTSSLIKKAWRKCFFLNHFREKNGQ